MDPTPQTYVQWYQSPTWSEGNHTIRVDRIFETSLDYATITVGLPLVCENAMSSLQTGVPLECWNYDWVFEFIDLGKYRFATKGYIFI